MSHIPIGGGRNSKGPVAKANEQVRSLEDRLVKGQWSRCRRSGLTVHIHAENHIDNEHHAWIRADDVEEFLKQLEGFENPQETKAP